MLLNYLLLILRMLKCTEFIGGCSSAQDSIEKVLLIHYSEQRFNRQEERKKKRHGKRNGIG